MQAIETKKQLGPSAARVLVSLASIIVIIFGLKDFGGFLGIVLLAFFLAVTSYPVTELLCKWKLPRWLAILLTLILDAGILAGIGWLTITLLEDLGQVWPSYETLFQEQFQAWLDWLKQEGVLTEEDIATFRWQEYLASIGGQFGEIVARAATFLKDVFFVLILMVFMMNEGGSFARKLTFISTSARGPQFGYLTRTARDIQRYLGIKTMVSAMTGLMAWGLCEIVGIDFAPLWGVTAFILNYIPAIGSLVASVPPILLALVVKGPVEATVIASGYFFINQLWGNFLEPMMMGARFGISTLAVLLSVLFWGWLWGAVGMFLAVPLTMMVKVMLDNSSELSWLGTFLGKEKKVSRLSPFGERWEEDPEFWGTAEGEGVAQLIQKNQNKDSSL